MFLSAFNEKQKILFLKLAEYAVQVDNKIVDAEEKLLEEYCKEMDIKIEKQYSNNLDLKILTDSINQEFSEIDKKKVLLEILVIVMCDDDFSIEEKEFICELGEALQIHKENVMDACELVVSMQETYLRLQAYFTN